MESNFCKNFILYKARNDGKGVASQWSISSKKDAVFLEMTNQNGRNENGNAKFDWENKICFKLGESDLGELIAVLAGLQKAVGPFDVEKNKHKGLFHSNNNGNAILYFGKDEKNRFGIYLSVKRGENQKALRHTISNGEACILSTLLRRAIEIIFKWN